MNQLPHHLQNAVDAPSQLTTLSLSGVNNLVVLGRGLGYAVSKEIALKLKEVCSIHTEAFSSAEFLHGPVTLVEQKLTVIDTQVEGESEQAHCEQISEIKSRGARLIHLHQCCEDVHPRLAPLLVLSSNESTTIANVLWGWSGIPVIPNTITFVAMMGLAHALVWPSVWPLALQGLGKFTAQGSALLIMGISGGALLPLVFGQLADMTGNTKIGYLVALPCYLFILFYAVKGHKMRSWK